jgi:hypothetical protein
MFDPFARLWRCSFDGIDDAFAEIVKGFVAS